MTLTGKELHLGIVRKVDATLFFYIDLKGNHLEAFRLDKYTNKWTSRGGARLRYIVRDMGELNNRVSTVYLIDPTKYKSAFYIRDPNLLCDSYLGIRKW